MDDRKTRRAAALVLVWTLLLLCGCAGVRETAPGPSADAGSPAETAVRETPVPERTGEAAETDVPETGTAEEIDRMFYAHVNGKVLEISAAENSSADAFLALLENSDVTVGMHDYGSFEKVGPLGTDLPANDEPVTTEPGDVILYQGNQITIYYDVNSWTFTRLGKVRGLSGAELREILGDGDVTVTFSLSGPA